MSADGSGGKVTAEPLENRHLAEGYAERLRLPDLSLPLGTPRGQDEYLVEGEPRSNTGLITQAIARFGAAGLQARRRIVDRLVADENITYGGTATERPARPWLLDPLPLVLDASEWAGLEKGLGQRVRLLDALMADLIGPQTLLHRRVIPAEIILGHHGWLAAAQGIALPSGRALPMAAFDLARGPDGNWIVFADRTQAPSGAGFAMANRRIVARAMELVHRGAPLRRLRSWFDILQAALQGAAHDIDDVPRVVLLSPGRGSETAYDQALLAILLGHPLAQSDDLVMRGGRLWLRTTGRLEAVDVVLRRVDAAWADSLDLFPQSRLGTPGLVAAARRGNVSIVNPLSAGVLENPGLFPFMDTVARALLGESLVLASPDTWWCGEPSSRQHVLANLSRLVIRRIHRGVGEPQIPGWLQSSEQLDALRRRIEAAPWEWTAQEAIVKSTAPVVTPKGLEPRSVVLRTFAAALGDEYHFLPGGLARVASTPDAFIVTNQSGAMAKDVWVLEPEGTTHAPRLDLEALAGRRLLVPGPLPGPTPRQASDLYWMGRYSERAEVGARLLMVADTFVEDHIRRPDTVGFHAMRAVLAAVTEVTTIRPGFTGDGAAERLADPVPHLVRALVDQTMAGSVAHSAQRAAGTGSGVRELLSVDTPLLLSRLARILRDARDTGPELSIQAVTAQVLESMLALAGLSAESLVRDLTWAFLDAGRRMERSQNITRLLRYTLAKPRPPVVEAQVVEAVLRVGDSLITYRRRMSAGIGSSRPAAAALELLLTDDSNPRSLAFQLERLRDDLRLASVSRLDATVRDLLGSVRALEIDELIEGDRSDLVPVLLELDERLRVLSDDIVATHFVALAPQRSFFVAELTREAP